MTTTTLTAPVIVRDLPAKVALVEQYQPDDDWTISARPALGPAWVLQWDRAALTVGDRDDLELARFIAAEKVRARHHLRRLVTTAAADLGLNATLRQPARPVVNAGLTRCPVCSCHVTASTHRPGSPDCHDARTERAASIRT